MVTSTKWAHRGAATALLSAALAWAPLVPSLQAQGAAPSPSDRGACDTAQKREKGTPATPVEKDAASGSKNMGATGWSGGGLGGSHNDTTHAAPTPESRTAQPETASGLDPTKSERMARATRCE